MEGGAKGGLPLHISYSTSTEHAFINGRTNLSHTFE
jgi:hypothetical protein